MTTRIIAGHSSEFMNRRSRVLRLDGFEIAIFKLSDGSFKAIENSCPHKGGKLGDGMVCDHHVFCPLHDWKINLNDGKVQHPDTGCVATFPVELDGSGNVILTLDIGAVNPKVS